MAISLRIFFEEVNKENMALRAQNDCYKVQIGRCRKRFKDWKDGVSAKLLLARWKTLRSENIKLRQKIAALQRTAHRTQKTKGNGN